ncbi:MAG: hypothetical protein AAB549_02595 [Patescibacteria group bacterium]
MTADAPNGFAEVYDAHIEKIYTFIYYRVLVPRAQDCAPHPRGPRSSCDIQYDS